MSDVDQISELLHTLDVQRAESEAYLENEYRLLLAAGITAEQLPFVQAFTQFHVNESCTWLLRKVGMRRDGPEGEWYWPNRKRRRHV